MNEPKEKTILKDNENLMCPECGSQNVQTSQKDYSFAYGAGEEKIDITVKIPVRKCNDCDFSYRDHIAEDICHKAVCQHLGVMNPAAIKSLRKLLGLTQKEFSKITKLGEATLSRWERGLIIQNNAYDNYMYLLGFSENLERLRLRGKQTIFNRPESIQPTFREIKITEELKQRQERFELQPCLIYGE